LAALLSNYHPCITHCVLFTALLKGQPALPVAVVECSSIPTGNGSQTVAAGALELANAIIRTAQSSQQLRLFAAVVCPAESLPLTKTGLPNEEMTREMFDQGQLQAQAVAFNCELTTIQNRHSDQALLANIMASSSAAAINSSNNGKLSQLVDGSEFPAVGSGSGFLDRPSKTELLSFESISRLLMWRIKRAPEEIAFVHCDQRGKEIGSLTFAKLGNKIARLVSLK
jgi:hypothetical protein